MATNDFGFLKRQISERAEVLEAAIAELEKHELVEKDRASLWRAHLSLSRDSLQDSLIRVAVVGSVKSGKSTLVNALVGHDLLKRGAGIVTSFITRILSHEKSSGWVELKSWDEINGEITHALQLLPPLGNGSTHFEPLDIREASHRDRLATILAGVQKEWQHNQAKLDPSFILLRAYLDGYDILHDKIGKAVNRILLDASSIHLHQRFVGDERQAVYLRDIELRYPMRWLGNHVELADCQGSDSPNPHHFALLQDYLFRSHFIIYVINSRMGLREADLKLLDLVQSLKMLPHTLFVFNLDLDTYKAREDMESSVERVCRELGWTVAEPKVFAFSALSHLIGKLGSRADEMERERLAIWTRNGLTALSSETGFEAFQEELSERITRQRARILLGSGLNRLAVVADALCETASTQHSLLSKNLGELTVSARHLEERQEALITTLGTLENAIAGLRDTLRREMSDAVDGFFDLTTGPVIRETLQAVENYPVDPKFLEGLHDPRQFVRQLHRFYLEFRQNLSRFLVDKVNMRTLEFAKDQERFLRNRLAQSSRAFWSLFHTAMEDYRRQLADLGIELRAFSSVESSGWMDWSDISPPVFSGFVDEHATGRGVLFMKFGLNRVARFIGSVRNRLGSRRRSSGDTPSTDSLHEAVDLVKAETRDELLYAFRDYRQNFKYAYLFRLLDEASAKLLEDFRTRSRMTQMDFSQLIEKGSLEKERREKDLDVLRRITSMVEHRLEEIESLRCALHLEWLPRETSANAGERAQSEPNAAL